MYVIKIIFFSCINQSYVNLILRPVTEPRRVEGKKFFLPSITMLTGPFKRHAISWSLFHLACLPYYLNTVVFFLLLERTSFISRWGHLQEGTSSLPSVSERPSMIILWARSPIPVILCPKNLLYFLHITYCLKLFYFLFDYLSPYNKMFLFTVISQTSNQSKQKLQLHRHSINNFLKEC